MHEHSNNDRAIVRALALAMAAVFLLKFAFAVAVSAEEAEAPSHPHIDKGDVEGNQVWPLQLHLPGKVADELRQINERGYNRYQAQRQRGQMAILNWTPAEAQRIRAVLIIPVLAHSLAFGEHAETRRIAEERGMGIVYLRHGIDRLLIQGILDEIADRTGIVEYRHAPWITWGMSANGRFPTNMTWQAPERSIASIVWHGEVPPWGGQYPPDWASFGHTHLHLNVNGIDEWAGTWHRHVRPVILNYQMRKDWLTNMVVAPGIGHGDHPEGTLGTRRGWTAEVTEEDPVRRMSRVQGFDYAAMFVDRALALRLPEEGYPTNGPLELRQVRAEDGYLIHPRALEVLLGEPWRPLQLDEEGKAYQVDPQRTADARQERGQVDQPLVRPARELDPEQRKHWLWVPDRAMAEAWWKIHAIKDQPFPLN
ncbi:MAG: hypothetical protein JJU36_16105 [Phycisphaeraceae bacterium]|nr:hypothetical protein [Phycisphaeraceae bacterium]